MPLFYSLILGHLQRINVSIEVSSLFTNWFLSVFTAGFHINWYFLSYSVLQYFLPCTAYFLLFQPRKLSNFGLLRLFLVWLCSTMHFKSKNDCNHDSLSKVHDMIFNPHILSQCQSIPNVLLGGNRTCLKFLKTFPLSSKKRLQF